MSARVLLVGAAQSGAGKTTLTLALLRAYRKAGWRVAAAKCGPDYIDLDYLSAAAGAEAINLDAFSMSDSDIRARAAAHRSAQNAELLIIEGAMGLFDGAAGAGDTPAIGQGAAARVAAALHAPILLAVHARRRAQSAIIDPIGAAAALAAWRQNAPRIAGVVLTQTLSERHAALARSAIEAVGFTVFGALPRDQALVQPSRHLGLRLAREDAALETFLDAAATAAADHIPLEPLAAAAGPLGAPTHTPKRIAPIGQRIAVASDAAFAFAYPHLLEDWRAQGAQISFFSPLANEPPPADSDAIFLPGGYPELHAANLSEAGRFSEGVRAAAAAGVTIYGECGGYMTLGDSLTDADGARWPMLGLLPLETRMTARRAALGYRHLSPLDGAPFRETLCGHEFHYAEITSEGAAARLFRAAAADGAPLGDIGLRRGSTSGSFAHVIAART